MLLVKASGWHYSSHRLYFLSRLFKCSAALTNKGSLSLAASHSQTYLPAPQLWLKPRCHSDASARRKHQKPCLMRRAVNAIVAMPICPASSYPLPSCCHSKGHTHHSESCRCGSEGHSSSREDSWSVSARRWPRHSRPTRILSMHAAVQHCAWSMDSLQVRWSINFASGYAVGFEKNPGPRGRSNYLSSAHGWLVGSSRGFCTSSPGSSIIVCIKNA